MAQQNEHGRSAPGGEHKKENNSYREEETSKLRGIKKKKKLQDIVKEQKTHFKISGRNYVAQSLPVNDRRLQ